jgi:cullin 1
MWSYSKNDIQLSYTKPKVTLTTNAYQTAVLMLFNEEDSLTSADIEARTKMSPGVIKQVLTVLTKAKVLQFEKGSFSVNMGFKSKKVSLRATTTYRAKSEPLSTKIRLNISGPIKAEQKKDSEEVVKAAEDDRKYVYQATIVR